MRWVLLVLSLVQFAIAAHAAGAERQPREVDDRRSVHRAAYGARARLPDLLRGRARRAHRPAQATHGMVQGPGGARSGRLGPLRAADDDARISTASRSICRRSGSATTRRGVGKSARCTATSAARTSSASYGSRSFTPNLSGELWIVASARPVLRQHDGRRPTSSISCIPTGARRRISRSAPASSTREPKATLVATTDRTDSVAHGRRRRPHVSDSSLRVPRRVQGARRVHEPQRQRGSKRMESRVLVLFLTLALVVGTSHGLRPRSAGARGRRRASRPSSSPMWSGARSSRRGSTPRISRSVSSRARSASRTSVSTRSPAARFAYHVTEGFFVELAAGKANTELTSFERLSGAAQLLTDSEREYSYYNVSLGYNIFPGETSSAEGGP